MGLTVTGAEGRVLWGYRPAATLRTWTITTTEAGARALVGTLSEVKDFAVSQRPLTFVAPNGWRWPIQSLQIVGASLTAVLGPKEKPYVSMPVRSA